MTSRVVLLTAVVAAASLSVVLAGPFTSLGTQPPLSFDPYPPSVCQSCHAGLDNGHNIRPWTNWAGTMMANAARDPIFWAALDVANHDIPDVGDFCLRCHVPVGWLEARSEPPFGSTDGCGLSGSIDEPDTDFEGVHCTICHRMMVNPSPPPDQQPVYHENANFWIDDEGCPNGFEPCRRGPYPYDDGTVQPPHPWVYSDYHVNADLCGNCHNVTHPAATLIDENGNDTGIPMPVERTFREWQQSAYATPGAQQQTCQSCHMPDATDDPASPCIFQTNNRTGDMPVHVFAGGNAWVPSVLAAEYPGLGRSDSYAATATAATSLLEQAATVELAAPEVLPAGGGLTVAATVTNLSGHKLPTGYPEGRRMWLRLEVLDGHDQVVWASGAYDPATGELTRDGQLRIYEVKPGIWDLNGSGECDTEDALGAAQFHFVLNNCIASDSRIPPLGFTGGDDLETRPVGITYPETFPGSGELVNFDVADYSAVVPAGVNGPLTVRATLLYQTISKEYVDFLRDEAVANSFPDDCISRMGSGLPDASRGELLHAMWTTYDRAPPVAMASAEAVVEVPIFADDFENGDLAAWSSVSP